MRRATVPPKPLAWATLLVALLLLLLEHVHSCLPAGGTNTGLTTGQRTYVCVAFSILSWGNVTQIQRIGFQPIADQYSRLTIGNSYTGNKTTDDFLKNAVYSAQDRQIAFHVESMGVPSFQKLFRYSNPDRIFPIFTAIINVEKGVVTGVLFDTGCPLCNGNDHCVANTYRFTGAEYSGAGATGDCYVDQADCAASPKKCQFTLYVVWTGTDSKGNYLQSVSKRFSLFSSFSIASAFNGLWSQAKNVKTNNMYSNT